MDQYALYLRKSRADVEAEARGEGETLSKHRAALTEYARRRGLFIAREYAEIVSGDTIAARPQMQQLLSDVKAGLYAGVIVNDVDRLGRGDSIDQEIIKLTFAAAHCLIITPSRDINPANPTDDDMLDFSMFMARFEYKKISARLKQGKMRSAAAGNFVTGRAPYGYKVARDGTRLTLEPDEQKAPIVRMIYDWYASGEAGYQAITHRLTAMGIKTNTDHQFSVAAVKRILHSPVYIGRFEYGARTTMQIIEDGRRVKKSRTISPPISIDNAHAPIVNAEVWQAVQDRVAMARFRCPVNIDATIRNPLAGLLYCAECGSALVRKMTPKGPILECPRYDCPTSATYQDSIEEAVIDTLKAWCIEYDNPTPPKEPPETTQQREALRRQIDTVSAQLTRAQELVEMGIYTPSEYMTRRKALQGQQEALRAELDKLSRKSPDAARAAILPEIRSVLDAYPYATTVEQKNNLLRSVVRRIVYHKTHAAKRNENGASFMTLDVYPIIVSI